MNVEKVRKLIKVVAIVLMFIWILAVWTQPGIDFSTALGQTGGVILGVVLLASVATGMSYLD